MPDIEKPDVNHQNTTDSVAPAPESRDLLAGFETARQPPQRHGGSYRVISPFADAPTESAGDQ